MQIINWWNSITQKCICCKSPFTHVLKFRSSSLNCSFENETSTNSCACLHLQPCHSEWRNIVWCIIVARFEIRLFSKIQICINIKSNPIPWNQNCCEFSTNMLLLNQKLSSASLIEHFTTWILEKKIHCKGQNGVHFASLLQVKDDVRKRGFFPFSLNHFLGCQELKRGLGLRK